MSHTETLLSLIDEFPRAFTAPETQAHPTANIPAHPEVIPRTPEETSAKTQQLLELIREFPKAFADPEQTLNPPIEAAPNPPTPEPAPIDHPVPLPLGYTQALRRRVSTQTWGAVDFYLVYAEQGLQECWVVAGKSGTEIQSLCEAIARLINLLLAHQVPIPEIIRQIRGIRGADSEGLGPHRILGLADLIGKVLQEAPTTGWMPMASPTKLETTATPTPTPAPSDPVAPPAIVVADPGQAIAPLPDWTDLSDAEAATLCPECGAELQQINGCSGGACNVCGFSSCS